MARNSNSVFERHSRYVQGGLTDNYGSKLGWWDRYVIETGYDDILLRIDPKYDKRPDLLAYDMYGRANLMWILLQFNHIVDVQTEFVQGAIIRVPSQSRVFGSILSNRTGGRRVT